MQNFKLTLFLCASLVSLPAAAGFEFVPSAGSAPTMGAYKAPPVQQNALPVVTAPAENQYGRAAQPQYQPQSQQSFQQPSQSPVQSSAQSAQKPMQMQPIMENASSAFAQTSQSALQYKMVTPPASSAQAAPQPLQAMPAQAQAQSQPSSIDWNQSAPVMSASSVTNMDATVQGSSAPFYQDYKEEPLTVTPSYQSTNATMGAGVRSQRLPVYSEVGVNGDAFMPYPRRQKKQSFFSINPFPFGNKTPVEDQAGLLFGQPVRVAASTSDSNYGMSGSSGPYMNRDNASAAAVMGAPVPPQKKIASANMPTDINLYSDNSYKSYDNVVGFGKDMPLTIALGQVVPDRYAFSYGKNVDMGKTASWEGGKPWNEVLQEMLSPLGLMAVISNDTVRIESKGQYSSAEFSHERSMTMASGLIISQDLQADASMSSFAQDVNYDSTIRLWTAPKDATLRRIVETWAYEAGVEVYWQSDYDYPMQAPVNIRGTFQEAITILLDGLREAQPRPVARLHPNLPDGPAVLVVETRHVIR